MATKTQTRFSCQTCGAAEAKWHGRCPSCGEWGTLVEEVVASAPRARRGSAATARSSQDLADVAVREAARISTRIREFDRVLGGGIVPGSIVLVGGDPGVGKSTLLLGALARMTADHRVLLVTGEESPAQVRLRAERIGGAGRIGVLAETDLDVVCSSITAEQPAVCVVDSIQTLWSGELSSAPGSVAQVREAAGRLLRVAKERGVAIVLIGHVTKDGAVAGPRVLEHLVDAVLLFEGEGGSDLRVLRAVKNRFGSTNELGVFEMTASGLSEVEDPSALLDTLELGAPGSVVACAMEGTRPLLLEVQALAAQSELQLPRRLATGYDRNRLAMLLAVLARHAGLPVGGADVFVNVTGGVRIDDPAADLAVALAVASALRGVPTGPLVAIGEIGLTGRLRGVPQLERRMREAARLGLGHVVAPAGTASPPGVSLRTAATIADAIALALPATA